MNQLRVCVLVNDKAYSTVAERAIKLAGIQMHKLKWSEDPEKDMLAVRSSGNGVVVIQDQVDTLENTTHYGIDFARQLIGTYRPILLVNGAGQSRLPTVLDALSQLTCVELAQPMSHIELATRILTASDELLTQQLRDLRHRLRLAKRTPPN